MWGKLAQLVITAIVAQIPKWFKAISEWVAKKLSNRKKRKQNNDRGEDYDAANSKDEQRDSFSRLP